MSEEQPEANEADAAEQRLGVLEEDEQGNEPVVHDEVDPADAEEQHRVVPQDEDDYR
jgi:hypothetical protein